VALSIKAEEADLLARRLVRLTGESMTDAVTVALRERLAREESRRAASGSYASRVADLAERLRGAYDTRPVTKAEWDAANGEP
jgi:antitoxin VapB